MTCVKFAAFDGAGFSESSLISGEVSEWSKEHAWKVCKSKGFEGSNPSLTAKFKSPFSGAFFLPQGGGTLAVR
jgi:hypothetical protein